MSKIRFKFLKNNKQVFYSIALMVIIPTAIIVNAFVFTNSFKKAINQSLYDKAMSTAETANAVLQRNFGNQSALQNDVENIAKFNQDIKDLEILSFSEDKFIVQASLGKNRIGQSVKDMVYSVAWTKNWPTADETAVNGKPDERFWRVVYPLKNSQGNKELLLSMFVSTKLVDNLTETVLIRSYIILLITVIFIILLIAVNTKLFHYSVLYNKIKEVDEMKDEFISMASHELKTPITVIGGYASLLLEDKGGAMQVNGKAKECLLMMQASADRLKNLVGDLLDVSRIDQGRLKINLKKTDVVVIIEGIVKELSQQAQEKNLKLSFEKPSNNVPQLMLDTDKFKQVLINLIGNAIKYTLSGSVSIFLEVSEEKAVIKVKDTGIGMNAAEREHLFEKFYRVKNEKTSTIQGTGLGLWITKEIVELMRGKILVDSIEGVGTQVSLEFPIE